MSQTPAITRKAAIRAVICLFLLAVLFLGYNWLKGLKDPTDFSSANTAGMILAVQYLESGSRAVIVKPDGSLWSSPSYVSGKVDRDVAWRPDGSAVFFSSDREKDVFNVYRWNLMHDIVERKSLGTRGQFGTNFGPASLGATNDSALITAGGFVLEFNPTEGSTRQVLPPVGRGAAAVEEGGTGGAGGASSQFEAVYQRLGNSFKTARWGKDKAWVVAVMRRDEGELLVLQSMTSAIPPIPIIAGDRIDFDINPVSGDVVFAVARFRLTSPESVRKEDLKAAEADLAVRHRVGIVALTDPLVEGAKPPHPVYVVFNKDDNACFGCPTVSPDGQTMLLIIGKYQGNANIEPLELAIMPAKEGGIQQKGTLVGGPVYDPSWHPNGKLVTYIKKDPQGKRSIYTITSQGTEERNVSAGKGDFARPQFSPQSK